VKTVKVAEVCRQTPLQSLVAQSEVSLGWVIHEFASCHDLHGIFLVGDQNELVGIINNQDLLQWAQINMDLPIPVSSVTLGQVRRLVQARRARDLAQPGSANAAVREDDTLDAALKRMARYDLTAIPVVDEKGRVVNDLRLSEVLAYALKSVDISLV
jgi:CBS domain-containing protein